MSPRIILYYQTFCGLKNIEGVTHIHLAATHFGTDSNNSPYIHLNDYSPYDKRFDSVWDELKLAKQNGIKIILMLGGAGGAFGTYKKNTTLYYGFLKKLLKDKADIIDGIDLDIEEEIDYGLIKDLVVNLKQDFGSDFIISFAPVSYALENDSPGMGGFYYKQLEDEIGLLVNYYNGQFYYDYDSASYVKCVDNDYNPEKVVFGAITSIPLDIQIENVKRLSDKYGKSFGGVFLWEYVDAPENWGKFMYNIIT